MYLFLLNKFRERACQLINRLQIILNFHGPVPSSSGRRNRGLNSLKTNQAVFYTIFADSKGERNQQDIFGI